jgi:hypothetical protein
VSVVIGRKYVLVINDAVVDYETRAPGGMVGRYMARMGARMVAGAKAQVGVRTGQLRASIHMRQERAIRGQIIMVGSGVRHALMHHEGTRPHVITGRNGGYLRFAARGGVVYTRVVNHPGTDPNKYLSDQLKYVNN